MAGRQSGVDPRTAQPLRLLVFPAPGQAPGPQPARRSPAFELAWENRGVAPAYQPFQLLVRLENGDQKIDTSVPAQNTRWLPGTEPRSQTYELQVPAQAAPGQYQFKIKLHSPTANRDVAIAIKKDRLDSAGFYALGTVNVVR